MPICIHRVLGSPPRLGFLGPQPRCTAVRGSPPFRVLCNTGPPSHAAPCAFRDLRASSSTCARQRLPPVHLPGREGGRVWAGVCVWEFPRHLVRELPRRPGWALMAPSGSELENVGAKDCVLMCGTCAQYVRCTKVPRGSDARCHKSETASRRSDMTPHGSEKVSSWDGVSGPRGCGE